jgi:hypothetical protein
VVFAANQPENDRDMSALVYVWGQVCVRQPEWEELVPSLAAAQAHVLHGLLLALGASG